MGNSVSAKTLIPPPRLTTNLPHAGGRHCGERRYIVRTNILPEKRPCLHTVLAQRPAFSPNILAAAVWCLPCLNKQTMGRLRSKTEPNPCRRLASMPLMVSRLGFGQSPIESHRKAVCAADGGQPSPNPSVISSSNLHVDPAYNPAVHGLGRRGVSGASSLSLVRVPSTRKALLMSMLIAADSQ
jgi:hypothetical protein